MEIKCLYFTSCVHFYSVYTQQHKSLSKLLDFRDPNGESTLRAFYQCIDWCLKEEFTNKDVIEAKLSVFAKVSVLHNNKITCSQKWLTHVQQFVSWHRPSYQIYF